MANPVTDPSLLEQLNGSGPKPVSDPALLAQLEPKGKSYSSTILPLSKDAAGNISFDSNAGVVGAIKGAAKSLFSAATLPHDVAEGTAKIPSSGAVPGSVPFGDPQSSGERVGDLAALGTPISPAARVGEKMIAGVGQNRGGIVAGPVPTINELKASSKSGYENARTMGVEIKPQGFADTAANIKSGLETGHGITDITAPKTHAILDRFSTVPEGATSVTIDNLRAAQQALGGIAKDARASMVRGGEGGQEFFAASKAQRDLAKYFEDIPESHILSGDAQAASKAIKNANSDYSAAKRAEGVTGKLDAAEIQTQTTGSGSNLDNKIRQKIAPYATNKNLQYGLAPAEVAQAERTAVGSPLTNAMRKFGKLGFNDGLSLLLHAGAALPTGGVSLGVGAAATASRKIAEKLTMREANKLEQMMRSRSNLARSREMQGEYIPPSTKAAIARALIMQEGQQ